MGFTCENWIVKPKAATAPWLVSLVFSDIIYSRLLAFTPFGEGIWVSTMILRFPKLESVSEFGECLS